MTTAATPTLPIDSIFVRDGFNVRGDKSESDNVDRLAGSIQHVGILTPLIVSSENGDGKHALLDGHCRLRAAINLGLTEVPVTFSDIPDTGGMAVANMVREQFSPLEEAEAVDKLIGSGHYTLDGAAEVLGWSKNRVTRRAKLLELPEPIRALWGPPVLAPQEAVEPMIAIQAVAPWLATGIANEVTRRHKLSDPLADMRRLVSAPYSFLQQLLLTRDTKFKLKKGQCLLSAPGDVELRGDPWPAEMRERQSEIENMRHQAQEWGKWGIALTKADVDAANATGVLLTLPRGKDGGETCLIVSTEWVVEALQARQDKEHARLTKKIAKPASTKAKGSATVAEQAAVGDVSPEKVEKKVQRDAEKQWREEARQPNLALGRSLMNNLFTVPTDDMNVARFFVYGMLGRNGSGMSQGYLDATGQGTTAARWAAAGLRYVMEDWQTVEEPKPGKVVVTYLDLSKCEERMWKWLDQAKTASELFGRGLVVYAAAKEALEHVLPFSQRIEPNAYNRGSVHNDRADKALEALIKTHDVVPPDLAKLARRIKAFDKHAEAKKEIAKAKAAKKAAAKTTKKASTA